MANVPNSASAPAINRASVSALFADGIGLTLSPAELQAAAHRQGFNGTLADWLPMLRAAGFREPRRGVFGAPCDFPTGKDFSAAPGLPAAPNEPAPAALEQPRFSYYRGGISTTKPYAQITAPQLYEVLVSPRFAGKTAALRAAPDKSQRDKLKIQLDYVTPAGTFTRRVNDGLEKPSGLIVLDFDHLPDVAAARAALLQDPEVSTVLALLFTSPSGDGLKAIVETDARASHLDNFRAYADYLGRTYAALGLCPDEAGKDVSRACFVPYAPDAWLAPTFAIGQPTSLKAA